MSYRYMRVIVFFDLPSVTNAEKKEYSKFRKFLLHEGFIMMQESVYTKLSLNSSSTSLVKERINKAKPKDGLVQVLVITEKQFSSIEYICGKGQDIVLDSDKRLIII